MAIRLAPNDATTGRLVARFFEESRRFGIGTLHFSNDQPPLGRRPAGIGSGIKETGVIFMRLTRICKENNNDSQKLFLNACLRIRAGRDQRRDF
jgi:hypothetical protein